LSGEAISQLRGRARDEVMPPCAVKIPSHQARGKFRKLDFSFNIELMVDLQDDIGTLTRLAGRRYLTDHQRWP
jgi:hypothetical protein